MNFGEVPKRLGRKATQNRGKTNSKTESFHRGRKEREGEMKERSEEGYRGRGGGKEVLTTSKWEGAANSSLLELFEEKRRRRKNTGIKRRRKGGPPNKSDPEGWLGTTQSLEKSLLKRGELKKKREGLKCRVRECEGQTRDRRAASRSRLGATLLLTYEAENLEGGHLQVYVQGGGGKRERLRTLCEGEKKVQLVEARLTPWKVLEEREKKRG